MRILTDRQLENGRTVLSETRPRIEAFETEDADLKAWLGRIMTRLEVLLDDPPLGTDGWILQGALTIFLPILDLEWLPSERRGISELPEADQATVRGLAQQRRILAFENSAVPPGELRYKLAVVDLCLESLQVLTVYGHENGRLGCLALLMDLLKELETDDGGSPSMTQWVC